MAQVQPSIELNTAAPDPSSTTDHWESGHSSAAEIEQQSLPPTDTGKAAWLVLAGSSLIQAPVWGFSSAFGIFQEYYESHPRSLKNGNTANVAVIGTTVTGIMYLISPFTFFILTRWPRLRRWFGPLGLFLTAVGFLASSFCNEVWQLILTQGVISALGCGLLFTPITIYLDEWWVGRKGLAYGIMWAGKSLTGVGLPFAASASLDKFGPANTLRAWSVLTIVLTTPLLHYLRPRLPLPPTTTPRRIDTAFTHHPTFWALQTGNILQSLGYFLPYTYFTSYTVHSLHRSSTIGTLFLSLINATSIPGGILIGHLGDKWGVKPSILISAIGSAITVFLFWGLSDASSGGVGLATLFAISYGFFAGGFSSTWSGVLREVKERCPGLDTGFGFGLLAGGRGIGNVVGGPISVALVANAKDATVWGFRGEYGGIILFTGATALLGGWGAWGKGSVRRV